MVDALDSKSSDCKIVWACLSADRFESHSRYNDRYVDETVVKAVLIEISLSTFFMSKILELLCTEYENVYGLKWFSINSLKNH